MLQACIIPWENVSDSTVNFSYQLEMPQYKIGGIDVSFPKEAYPCQLDFMEKSILAVNNSQNALLESPTGKLNKHTYKIIIYNLKFSLYRTGRHW